MRAGENPPQSQVALSVDEMFVLTDAIGFSAQRLREAWPRVDLNVLHLRITRVRESARKAERLSS